MEYLESFFNKIGADTEFKKVVASAGFVAYFTENMLSEVENTYKTVTGKDYSKNLWKESADIQDYIAGSRAEDAWYLVDAFRGFDEVKVEPYFNESEFRKQTLQYIKDNRLPAEQLEKIDVTNKIWDIIVEFVDDVESMRF